MILSPTWGSADRRVPPHGLRVALALVKTAILVVLAAAAIGGMLQPATTAAPQSDTTTGLATRIDHLMTRERCSYTGFGAGVIPARAILRTGTDTVRVVSFARGWAAYEGRRPGVLVAVCRGRANGR